MDISAQVSRMLNLAEMKIQNVDKLKNFLKNNENKKKIKHLFELDELEKLIKEAS